MSAQSDYWRCGTCGFKNRPDVNHRAPVLNCEQCGAPRDAATATAQVKPVASNQDYNPDLGNG